MERQIVRRSAGKPAVRAVAVSPRRRLLAWLARGGALAAGAALLPALPGTAARAQTGAAIVGSWIVATTRPQTTLATFSADGTVVGSNPPLQPAPAGVAVSALSISTAHGSWRQQADGTVGFTFVELEYDPQATLLFLTWISGSASLDSSLNAASGPYSVQVTLPSGQVVHTENGTLQFTRITSNQST
ncbi:MAG TPA: hypothetical protein VFA70_05745 [Dehalococcoidia bacterium]|jgi:hypothetical protein|nr:hypothetical protein [Dehalococcoidia bacterium]